MAENTIQWDKDADGIVTLTMDDPTGSANVMNEHYAESMHNAVERLVAEKDSITGVVITSAKKTFFAGGDLKAMIKARPGGRGRVLQHRRGDQEGPAHAGDPRQAGRRRHQRRRARRRPGDRAGVSPPHRRRRQGRQLGLPEVTLGLLPGGGGVTRTVRMLGIQNAFMNVLSQGTRFKPAQGQGDRPGRRARRLGRGAGARRQGVDQGQPRLAHPAVGCQGLQDAWRHPVQPGAGRHPAVVPGAAEASSSRVRRCRRRGPSWTRPSRVRRSTSTPPAASRAATSLSWSPARSPRT